MGTLQWYQSFHLGSACGFQIHSEDKKERRTKLWRGWAYSRPFSDLRREKKRNALKLQKGSKEERFAERPLEGFKKQKKMHEIPIIIEEVKIKETT